MSRTPKPFNSQTASSLKIGDLVAPLPLWNQSCGRRLQLPKTCQIIAIETGSSQTRVLLSVHTFDNEILKLDSAWFERPQAVQESLFV